MDTEPTHPSAVTVVLPCGNTVAYLDEALDSCLRQTQSPASIVIVDDATTPSAHEQILRASAVDPRVRVVTNNGSGLVDALNTALAYVETPLLARMDADDVCRPNRFELQQKVLERHPEVVAVGGLIRYVDETGMPLPKINWIREGFPITATDVLFATAVTNPVFHPTAMIRTLALRALGGYRHEFTHIEDYDLWVRLLTLGDIVNIPNEVLDYRRHAAQVGETEGGTQAMLVDRLRSGLLDNATYETPMARDVYGGILISGDLDPRATVALVRDLARAATAPVAVLVAPTGSWSKLDMTALRLAAGLNGLTEATLATDAAAIHEWLSSIPQHVDVTDVVVHTDRRHDLSAVARALLPKGPPTPYSPGTRGERMLAWLRKLSGSRAASFTIATSSPMA